MEDASTFVLTNAELGACLEIPSDDSGEFDPVELHAHCHGGDSQLWAVGNGGRIVSVLGTLSCPSSIPYSYSLNDDELM